MDRNIVYAGSIPLDTDILSINRNAMLAIGSVLRLLVGPGTCVDGLECTPTNPPSMSVSVAPGSITQLSVIDVAPYGSLAADTSTPIMKMGINSERTDFNFQAPNIPGQSVNYLIQASLQETDTNDIVLPYYNAADPSLSYSGPGNSGVAQSTLRRQLVNMQVKPGVPAPTGTQTTPSPDEGAVGLYSVSVASGQTAINASAIMTLPTAPFLYWKAPQLRPGFGSGVRSFTSSGSFIVPHGVTQVEVELWGGGSGSFASVAGLPSGGGAGGGYAKRLISGLTPGQALDVVVGAGGVAGTVSGTLPSNGGTSSVSNIVSATGGRLNYLATVNAPQNGATPPGTGVNGDVNLGGSAGQAGLLNQGGMGGAAPMGGSQNSGTSGNAGIFPGGGASGAGTGANSLTPYDGAAGANGLVVIRW